MKEFIFTWRIENISYSWHKRGEEITSPSFVADTLQNTSWTLRLWPKGYLWTDCISVCLNREEDEGPENFVIDCEFSCVSANNLTLATRICPEINASTEKSRRIGFLNFLQMHEVFVRRRSLYLSRDILTLRCRMWKREGGDDEFGQCFGITRLEIERILLVDDMKPRINKEKTILVNSNKQNKLLISLGIFHEEDGLKLEINPINTEMIKFSTFKFSAVGRNRKPCKYISSWLDKPCREVWKAPFSTTENKTSITNKLKMTCEFIYSIGEETKSIEKINPCSFKFPEFPSNCILSCIPSGKLSDCPSVCKDLLDLYEKQILCDVQLKTQTKSFWVHKVVLCARSPVFLAMFTFDMMEKASKCVEIEDLEADILEKFLTFLYTDSLEELQLDTILKLYYAGDKYQVERLKCFCCSYCMNRIDDVPNICELLVLADKHSDPNLNSKVEDYIVRNHEWIFSSNTWKEFSVKNPFLAAKAMICKYNETEREHPAKKYKSPSYPNVIDDLRSLNLSQAISDIVIQSKGTTLHAHKTILCAGSLRLRKVITKGKSTSSLKMEDLEEETVSRLLLFLYTDSLGEIKWEDATKLYHAAVAYQIERLKIKCSCFFLENLDATTASHLLQLAHKYRDARLKLLVEDFSSLHDKDITLSEDWQKIDEIDSSKRVETRLSKRLRLEKGYESTENIDIS